MLKLLFCAHRLPHLSRSEFQHYWRETHAALVLERAEALRMRRYVQVHTLEHPGNDALRGRRGSPEPFDGVAEAWWDSWEDLVAGATSEDGRRATQELLDDERNFIDWARSPLWLAEDHVVIDG